MQNIMVLKTTNDEGKCADYVYQGL